MSLTFEPHGRPVNGPSLLVVKLIDELLHGGAVNAVSAVHKASVLAQGVLQQSERLSQCQAIQGVTCHTAY